MKKIKVMLSVIALFFGTIIAINIFEIVRVIGVDRNIANLCREDGGITIYQQVEITRSEFESYHPRTGTLPIPTKSDSGRNGFPYYQIYKFENMNAKNSSIIKSVYRVFRRSDDYEVGRRVNFLRPTNISALGVPLVSGYSCMDLSEFDGELLSALFKIKEG